jgi:hypothetical protein
LLKAIKKGSNMQNKAVRLGFGIFLSSLLLLGGSNVNADATASADEMKNSIDARLKQKVEELVKLRKALTEQVNAKIDDIKKLQAGSDKYFTKDKDNKQSKANLDKAVEMITATTTSKDEIARFIQLVLTPGGQDEANIRLGIKEVTVAIEEDIKRLKRLRAEINGSNQTNKDDLVAVINMNITAKSHYLQEFRRIMEDIIDTLPVSRAPVVTAKFVFENDVMGNAKTDRNYTGGFLYSRTTSGKQSLPWASAFQKWLNGINRWTRLDPKGNEKTDKTWWAFGGTSFTPQKIEESRPLHDDRPFAALLYLSSGYIRKEDRVTTVSEFQVGLLGTTAGRDIQRTIHKVCCKDRIPEGWGHQIGDGGLPTLLYSYAKSYDLVNASGWGGAFNLSIGAGFDLGYYTRGFTGFTLQYGLAPGDVLAQNHSQSTTAGGVIRPYKTDFGLSSTRPSNKTLAAKGLEKARQDTINSSKGVSFWLNRDVSYFYYNELIQGVPYAKRDVYFELWQMHRRVQTMNFGFELTWLPQILGLWTKDQARIYWTQNWRTRDLNIPKSDPVHRWGGFQVTWDI